MNYNSRSPRQKLPGLSKGQEINMYDGPFVQHNTSNNQPQAPMHVCSKEKDGFQHLQAHVATAAFDPKEKMDAPKCHPNTRVAVLDTIFNWILQALMTLEWIMWLNGAAGAGKSAIARSIVERCLQMKIPVARFFFFRTDSTRNSIDPIVATLAHQLIRSLPDLRMPIVTRIQEDPLIFSESLETQFNCLIFEPLIQLKEQSTTPPTVLLLFDGLDELSGDENQVDLIKIMANFVSSKAYPLLVFFGSRNENQIKQAFESRKTASLVRPLPLDDDYMSYDDIRLFLVDSFAEIRESHPFRKLLPELWPTPEPVDEIVTKSCGQFIFASVVAKFISMPKMHPAQQLDIIRGLRPAGALTPFSQLDALYLQIFSQVEDLPNTMYILAAAILCNMLDFNALSEMFPDHISKESVPIHLASLAAVVGIDIDYGHMHFLHTSLPDFLLDHTRSRHFHIDRAVWSARLSTEYYSYSSCFPQYTRLLGQAQPTAELRERLINVYPNVVDFFLYEDMSEYLSMIKNLDFGDNGEVYRLQLEYCTRESQPNNRHNIQDLEEEATEANSDASTTAPELDTDEETASDDHDSSPVVQQTMHEEAENGSVVSVVQEQHSEAASEDQDSDTDEETVSEDHNSSPVAQETMEMDAGDRSVASEMQEQHSEAVPADHNTSATTQNIEEGAGDSSVEAVVQQKHTSGARNLGRLKAWLRKHLSL